MVNTAESSSPMASRLLARFPLTRGLDRDIDDPAAARRHACEALTPQLPGDGDG